MSEIKDFELIQQITSQFSNCWQLNDSAHRYTHFYEVYQCGKLINERVLKGKFDTQWIVLAAFFHDLFSWSRVNHHILSMEFVKSTDHPLFDSLSVHDRQQVAWACGEHRASFKGLFSCQFAELINAADRQRPGSLDEMIDRSRQYALNQLGLTPDQADKHVIRHIKEKFGRDGYARFPELWKQAFPDELEFRYKEVDQL